MQLLQSIGHMFASLSGDTILGKCLVAGGALLTAFFVPIVGLLVTCFATTFIDMIYGMKVARKFNKKITSGKNWKGTLRKLKDELLILSLARLIEFTVLGAEGVFVLTGGATIIISLTELWSIIENLNTLDPTGPWKVLKKFLRKKGEDYTGITLEELDNEHNSDIKVDSETL